VRSNHPLGDYGELLRDVYPLVFVVRATYVEDETVLPEFILNSSGEYGHQSGATFSVFILMFFPYILYGYRRDLNKRSAWCVSVYITRHLHP